jgi:hypothetical protein
VTVGAQDSSVTTFVPTIFIKHLLGGFRLIVVPDHSAIRTHLYFTHLAYCDRLLAIGIDNPQLNAWQGIATGCTALFKSRVLRG